MGPGQLLDRLARSQVHLDEKPAHVHKETLLSSGLLCLDTSPGAAVSYVLKFTHRRLRSLGQVRVRACAKTILHRGEVVTALKLV